MRSLSIVALLLFGLVYSAYLSTHAGAFLGIAISLLTIGLASTIYLLEKKANNRIIIYIWVAIVVIIVCAYISTGVFQTANIFRNPVKFI